VKKVNFLPGLVLALALAPTLFGAAAPAGHDSAGGVEESKAPEAPVSTDIVIKSAADCWLSTRPDAVRRWKELAERKGFKLVGFIQGARTTGTGSDKKHSLHAVLLPLHEMPLIPWLRGIAPLWVVLKTAGTLPSKHALSLAQVRRSNRAGQLISKPDPDILVAIMKTIQDNVPQLLDYDLTWLMNTKLVDITSCPAEMVGDSFKALQNAAKAEYNSDRRVQAYDNFWGDLTVWMPHKPHPIHINDRDMHSLKVACDCRFDSSRLSSSFLI